MTETRNARFAEKQWDLLARTVSRTALAILVCLALQSERLLAQGCAMCRSSIAAQAEAVINSINTGILVLLFPPLLIMTAIVYYACRERN